MIWLYQKKDCCKCSNSYSLDHQTSILQGVRARLGQRASRFTRENEISALLLGTLGNIEFLSFPTLYLNLSEQGFLLLKLH